MTPTKQSGVRPAVTCGVLAFVSIAGLLPIAPATRNGIAQKKLPVAIGSLAECALENEFIRGLLAYRNRSTLTRSTGVPPRAFPHRAS